VGPRADEGSQHRRRQVARSGNHSVRWRGRKICSGGKGAQGGLHLPKYPVNAPWGAGSRRREFIAPPGAGSLRVRAPEVPEEARFASSCLGAPMQRGPPVPGVHRARIFALFQLPGGRPWHFAPELDPAAATEAEGSISLGARREK
jgi:hypothetical protein